MNGADPPRSPSASAAPATPDDAAPATPDDATPDDAAPEAAGPRPAAVSWPRRAGRKLRAVGIGLVIALVLAEGGLRLAGVGRPIFHRPDRTYGQVLIPGAEGEFVTEGRAWVTINADGFRDVAHPKEKPPGTLRIAVLGDAFTEALQVPRKETFWSLLGDELSGCGGLAGQRVETMNFGVSGYATAQELLLLDNRVWQWSPNVVLLAFATADNVADNSPALGSTAAPFYRLDGDQLVLDSSRTRELGTSGRAALWMIRHSRVLQLANRVRLNLASCGRIRGCGEDLAVARGQASRRNHVYLPPADDDWREAWRVTEALLRRMRDDVAGHHARFLMVTLSTGIQVHPDAAVRERFRTMLGATDLFYADHRLADFAQREGISELALAPILAEQAARDGHYLHGWPGPDVGKGHWNREGHQLAARTIAPWMCTQLSPAAPPPVPVP